VRITGSLNLLSEITDNLTAIRFDETYALASTQNLKNKDIPEGGAKGTILPSYVLHFIACAVLCLNYLIFPRSLGANPRRCFEKYVDVGCIVNDKPHAEP
jgi:hypothetical protein